MSLKSTKRMYIIAFLFLLLIPTKTMPSSNFNHETIPDYCIEVIKLDESDSTGRFEGYNLFVLERCNAQGLTPINRTLLITDLEGNIYLSKEFGKEANLDFFGVEFVNSTTLLYGDQTGAKLWNIETNVTKNLNVYGHHDYERNYANDTYFAISKYIVNIEGVDYLFDMVREYSDDGSLVWQLNTRDFTNLEHWCPYEDMVETSRDITHTNTVFFDEDEDVIYINSRTLNTIYKIDHKTKEVIWSLGEYGDFTLFDLYGNEVDIIFYHAHALEKTGDNTFILFDNDEHNQTDNSDKQSRMLEFKIDTNLMYANTTWEWIAPETYYTGWWGDCDVLPNSNRLGVFGTPWHPSTSIGARLVEVNLQGDIVWEMNFDKNGQACYGVYKMERFHFAPIVSIPELYDLGDNGSLVEWDVWYNFRSKTVFEGEYFISIDDEVVETGILEFPKYWLPTTISYHLNDSFSGDHDITLVVSDEGGHLSNETDRYSSTGKLSFKTTPRIALILGLSLGLGIPTLSGIIAIVWIKLFSKKILFKRKK